MEKKQAVPVLVLMEKFHAKQLDSSVNVIEAQKEREECHKSCWRAEHSVSGVGRSFAVCLTL
jgi:hypothetical protein